MKYVFPYRLYFLFLFLLLALMEEFKRIKIK